MKINKILGKRGRITIPYEIRLKMGFKCNDVVSFEEQDNNTVIIRREKQEGRTESRRKADR